jgi:SAM-dependent methyltransferase
METFAKFASEVSSSHKKVLDIGCNDGTQLDYFKKLGYITFGVDPAKNLYKISSKDHVVFQSYFDEEFSNMFLQSGVKPDIITAQNVFPHTADPLGFLKSAKKIMHDDSTLLIQTSQANMIINNEFDTIYHEHFSYISFLAMEKVFSHHGLTLFDVEEVPTHGGSLRIFARHTESVCPGFATTKRVEAMRRQETGFGLTKMETYTAFGEKVEVTKRRLLKFMIEAKEAGKTIVGYGAAAKGVTLVNYCGVGDDLMDYVVDKSPYKQNHYMPGVRIPIYPPERIFETKPDYVLILPWNLSKEIRSEMERIREWGGRFVVPIPEVTVLD